ncbi:hypothetical protein G7Y89_g15236 [Cudoniella acicularis]|uniref:Uncharacterized protein n=1 Tax=Cudoniella acicularis TaxID=354080 RepID=A0A8H4QRZ5_9HELO|nr:hypothetical protein G7Y89_g15236 [Cudoniella acicularis]
MADSNLPPLHDTKMTSQLEEIDTTSTAGMSVDSTSGLNTPTNSTFTIIDEALDYGQRDAVPWPGSIFVIRDLEQGRIITLKDGKLILQTNPHKTSCIYWICIEHSNGFLGFRSSGAATYIGHDGGQKFICEVKHHRDYEWFCVRKHPEGGYVLLINRGKRFLRVRAKEDTGDCELVEGDGEDKKWTRWEFVKVD